MNCICDWWLIECWLLNSPLVFMWTYKLAMETESMFDYYYNMYLPRNWNSMFNTQCSCKRQCNFGFGTKQLLNFKLLWLFTKYICWIHDNSKFIIDTNIFTQFNAFFVYPPPVYWPKWKADCIDVTSLIYRNDLHSSKRMNQNPYDLLIEF